MEGLDSQDILHINALIVRQDALGTCLGAKLSINGKMAGIKTIISREEHGMGIDHVYFMGQMWGRAFYELERTEEGHGGG